MESHHLYRMFLLVLVTMVTVGAVFVPDTGDTDTLNKDEKYITCPTGCSCSIDEMTAQCQYSVFNYSILEFIDSEWKVTRLRIHGDSLSWNSENTRKSVTEILFKHSGNDVEVLTNKDIQVYSELTHLDISYVPIQKITDQDFGYIPKLQLLTLTNNNISEVASNAFKNLYDLNVLNLDGNHITTLSDGQFIHLEKLQRLHMRSNGLSVIRESHLEGLDNLVTLDLQNNHIQQIETFVQTLNGLETFNIQRNSIVNIDYKSVAKLLSFHHVYIDGNPFWCTCSLKHLLSVYKVDTSVFVNRDVHCVGPKELEHVRFEDVNVDLLPCNGVNVTAVSHGSSLIYQSDLVLDCSVVGDKPLGQYWITPWGESFTSRSAKSLFPDELKDMKLSDSYYALNLLVTSKVYVSENGSLHIDKYRGYFAGDYTCVGINLVGVSNKTLFLGIETKVRYLYISSLFIGAYCSGAMLGLAVVVGTIRLFVNKCLHSDQCNCCCCRCDDVEIIDEKFKIEEQEINVNCASSIDTIEYIDYDPNQSPPNPPVNSPMSRLSPGVCRTPNSEVEDSEDQSKVSSPPIWDQLEEVRFRLRCGAERKIRKVRCHVRNVTDAGSMKIRNIKDAGTIKIQHIKETGSNAASKVKNHVTSGMVQVKYGMQSIKEFCGTGDMGPGTISMVSVSTDVDTKEQVHIVKSHTFV
ncbi:hypothetical protein ACF0H5_019617 [Mactra antiquata]